MTAYEKTIQNTLFEILAKKGWNVEAEVVQEEGIKNRPDLIIWKDGKENEMTGIELKIINIRNGSVAPDTYFQMLKYFGKTFVTKEGKKLTPKKWAVCFYALGADTEYGRDQVRWTNVFCQGFFNYYGIGWLEITPWNWNYLTIKFKRHAEEL